jgi:hypothetical protein
MEAMEKIANHSPSFIPARKAAESAIIYVRL